MTITAKELQRMRDVQEQFFPDLCTVERPNYVINAAGSTSDTLVVVYDDLPCEVTPKVLRQIIEHVGGGQVQSALRWNVVMPVGTVIMLDDIITNKRDGSQYEVNGDQSIESWETAVTAQCLKVA